MTCESGDTNILPGPQLEMFETQEEEIAAEQLKRTMRLLARWLTIAARNGSFSVARTNPTEVEIGLDVAPRAEVMSEPR